MIEQKENKYYESSKNKKGRCGTIYIIIALLAVMVSIFFAVIKISNTISHTEYVFQSYVEETQKELRKNLIALMYAYTNSRAKNEQITSQALKEGYDFANRFLLQYEKSKAKAPHEKKFDIFSYLVLSKLKGFLKVKEFNPLVPIIGIAILCVILAVIKISRITKVVWLYALAITEAELVTSFFDPRLGLVIHSGILSALLLHSAFTFNKNICKLYLALSLGPIIRILSLSMPLSNIPQIYWYLIISIPIIIAALIVASLSGFKRKDIGLTLANFPLQLLVGASGILIGFVEYFILKPQPLIFTLRWQEFLIPAPILFICTGFIEEFVFRGVMQRASIENFGKHGLFYISFIFAALHIGHLSFIDVLFVFGIALYFGWIAYKSKSILGVSAAHGITNITLYLIWPFLF